MLLQYAGCGRRINEIGEIDGAFVGAFPSSTHNTALGLDAFANPPLVLHTDA